MQEPTQSPEPNRHARRVREVRDERERRLGIDVMTPAHRTVAAGLAALVVVSGLAIGGVMVATRPATDATATSTNTTGGAATSTSSALSSPRGQFGPYPSFGPASVFKEDISKAPLDPRSAGIVAKLSKDVADNWGGLAGLNIDKYSAGYAVAQPDTPRQDVHFDDCQGKGGKPPGLYDGAKHFVQVPIPADAVQSPGSDGHLGVYDPQADKLWEFWVAKKRPDGSWQACWGGRIDDVSKANGQFPAPFGVGAAGLATLGYMVTLQEAHDLKIEHALGMVVMESAPGFSYPANRDDGTSSNPNAVQEGSRLRLDPTLDVKKLGLGPLGEALATAAQKYGFIVIDKGGAVAVMAENGERLAAKAGGKNPWSSVDAGVGKEAWQAFQDFPWNKLQLVQKDWGKPQ